MDTTRLQLHWMIRLSHGTELGAARAYAGHVASLRTQDAATADLIERIRLDEVHHRRALAAMMAERNLRPFLPFELLFWCMGTVIGLGCHIWGAWASAFGASLFEINGVAEFSRLAVLADRLGDTALADQCREMELQEAAHRVIFAQLSRGVAAAQIES